MSIAPESITLFVDFRDGMGYKNEVMPLRQDNEIDEGTPHHPLSVDIFEGGMIETVAILEDWEDDHERCYTVRVVTSTGDYVFAIWWASAMFFVDLGRAIGDRGKSLAWAKAAAGIET